MTSAIDDCSPQEVEAFETWAKTAGHDMTEHPLHWLFLDPKTYAARQAWKAALAFARASIADEAKPMADVAVEPKTSPVSEHQKYLRNLRFRDWENDDHLPVGVFQTNSGKRAEVLGWVNKYSINYWLVRISDMNDGSSFEATFYPGGKYLRHAYSHFDFDKFDYVGPPTNG